MNRIQDIIKTLYIPLCSRIYISKRFSDYFYDELALNWKYTLEDERILNRSMDKSSEYAHIVSVTRTAHIDTFVRNFTRRNQKCNVVSIGCGFNNLNSRINNSDLATFYEVDVPYVIDKRKDFLKIGGLDVEVKSEIFNLDWTENIDKSLPTMFVADGVFMYYDKQNIVKFINEIGDKFSDVEIVFDTINEKSKDYVNKYFDRLGRKGAKIYFYVNDVDKFVSELKSVRLINNLAFFDETKKILSNRVTIQTKLNMYRCDKNERCRVIHLKIK
ncbi:MAG: class I SAM-dependent methyltransferase [Lachnospirales bacterium]